MQILSYKFTPGLWPTVIFVLLLPLFISLGFWQINRADEKHQLYENYIDKKNKPAVPLAKFVKDARHVETPADWTRVKLKGRFSSAPTILLDNKIVNGQVGYYVYKPFKPDGLDKLILINLGWVAAALDRTKAPELYTTGLLDEIIGVIKQPQYSGIALGKIEPEFIKEDIIRVQSIDYQLLSDVLNKNLEHYIVRVSSESKTDYYTNWPEPGFGKDKHYGYAFQWFSFATVLVGLYLYLNIHRIKCDGRSNKK